MKVVSKIKVLVAALAGAVVWSAGAELVVETKDFLKVTEPTTITGPTNIYINNFAADISDNSRIQANLSLTSQAFLRFVGNVAGKKTTYVDIGPASGDGVIRISTDAKSGIYSSYRYSTSEDAGHGQPYSYVVTRLGGLGGSATFDISGAVSPVGYDGFQTPAFGVWFYHLLIDEHATTSGGLFDIATINAGGVLNLRRFTNDANKPARILFNGGRFDLWYIGLGNDYSPFCGGGEGKTLILESVGDNLINLYKTAKGANLVEGTGKVKFVSANTLRIMGNSFWTLEKKSDTYVTKNYLTWNLPDTVGRVGQDGDFAARIDWSEFSGDIQLGGSGSGATGLWLQGNDQLPWGPGKGKMIIGLNSWSDTPTARTEVSALILSDGKTVHLNGIENTGSNGAKCYVTNYNASATSAYATFVLGDGDVDGRLAVHVTAKCAIEKTGAGTLTIDNVTFDETATLALQAGKTIIDQDLYNTLNERGTFTIAEGATVICEKVIDVASGEVTDTTQYTDCADGTVLRIRKTGAGTLILDNAGNSFTGGIVVEGGKVEIAQDDVVWTGAGADTSATTTENWKNSVLPNFTSPLTRDHPVFGEGGDEAVFPAGASRLNGLLFNREGDFTVEGSDATTLLKIAAPIEVAATASPHVYTITAPIGIENEGHAMTVGEGQTLKIKNVVKPSGVNAKVSLCGPGEVLLEDAAFAGVVDAKNNVKLRLKGNVGAADDTDRIEVSCYKSDDSVNTRLLIDGATVDKPIHAAIGASDWIEVTAGSSNVFKKPFSVGHTGSNPATQFILKEGNVNLVFEGGLCEGSCVGMTGVRSSIDFGVDSKVPNVKFIFNGPLCLPDKTYGTAGASYTYQGPIIIFNCTGNTCGKYYSLQYADTFFTVDNAFTDTPYFSIGGGSSTADFTTTRQEIPNFVIADSKGYLTGSYPATLAITEGWADRATAIAKKFGPSGINGWLKLEKSGPGYHVVGLSTGGAKAYASCGDIEVSGGTLEFLPNTTWQKGTNIIVRGTGRLVLNASNHFGSQAVIWLADTGKIVLPANTALSVKNLYVNGMPIRKGTYSYSPTDFPWLEGEGATITATSDPAPFVNVWTGAGADNLTTTAGNWEGGILDQRVVQTAEFGAGGDEAVFPAGETAFESIVFSREGGFTLRGVDETATVRLAKREAIAFVGGYTDETTVYTVEPKLRFDSAETTIDVKETNQTLVVKNEITGSVNLVKKGFGTLELDNAAFAGALTHTTAGRLVLKGTVGADDGATITNNPYNGAVEFAGATVNKNIQYAYKGTQLQVLANTTNSVLGTVGISGDLTYTLESNSQLVFDDVVSGSGTISLYMNTNGVKSKNGEVVFRQPLNITGTISCEYYHLGPRIVYEQANNHFGTAANKNWGPTYGTHILKQSPAFDTEFGLSIGSGGDTTTVDLTTTHQRFARILCGKAAGNECGIFRGDYPAELEITEACADRETALADSNNFNPVRIEGCLKLTKSGTGYQILGRMGNPVALTSYGDIEVSDGVLEFADKVTWLNGTNFIVKGEGKLILTATDKPQIGPQAVFRFANNGEVEIPSGVTVSVAAAFVDGAPVSAGTYDADTVEGPMAGRVTGGGKLRVRSGMMLILR